MLTAPRAGQEHTYQAVHQDRDTSDTLPGCQAGRLFTVWGGACRGMVCNVVLYCTVLYYSTVLYYAERCRVFGSSPNWSRTPYLPDKQDTSNGRQARSWDEGADNLGKHVRARLKHASACGANMCGVGGPISDASTGRANALQLIFTIPCMLHRAVCDEKHGPAFGGCAPSQRMSQPHSPVNLRHSAAAAAVC
jgi:hypothetical protein